MANQAPIEQALALGKHFIWDLLPSCLRGKSIGGQRQADCDQCRSEKNNYDLSWGATESGNPRSIQAQCACLARGSRRFAVLNSMQHYRNQSPPTESAVIDFCNVASN